VIAFASTASAAPFRATPAPGAIASAATAEQIAKAFLAQHLGELAPGSGPNDFVVTTDRLDDGIRSIGFAQHWHGDRVVGGQLGFVFAHDKLTDVIAKAVPNISAQPLRHRERGERVVMRTATGDRVVDRVRAGDADIYTDDRGEVARISLRRDATGTLQYNAGVRYAAGPRSDTPAHTATITVNATATTTAANGTFSWAGAAAATVAPSCTGTEVMVVNQAGAAATTALDVQPGGGAIWNAANSELDDAQVSTYVYGTVAAERAKRIDPATSAWLDPFVFYVNESNPCNAFSSGTDVHLARGTPECENTGRVADIVMHEFGHSLHFHESIPDVGAYQLQLSEGLADFNAANITEDSGIGRGLDFTDAASREIDPVGREYTYPRDVTFDAHATGMIVSGALWDLRKALIAELGHDPGVALTEKIFLGVLRRAADLPTSYDAALIADDDDGDLANGTPHFCTIQHAFGVHGLAPDFADLVIGTPGLADSTISVPVTVPAAGPCPVRQVVGMHVLWKVGDNVVNDLELTPSDAAWSAPIPVQPDGTVVSFSVDITLDDGTQQSLPDNPADPMYQAFVGSATPIWCETFDHAPAMWMTSGTAPAEWQWARPTGLGLQSGDPSTTFTGDYIYGTNLANGGAYGAGETTAVTTPTIDTSAFQIIHLQYWRWLTVDDNQLDQAVIVASTDTLWHNAKTGAGTLAHVDREWRFQDIDLTPHLYYDTIAVTWQLQTDGTGERGGWNLDDVCVVGMAKVPRCGDNYVDLGEECDDGNTFSGDGCTDKCIDELSANGGGGCCSASGGGPGSGALALAVLGIVVPRRRRRRQR
jgi:MYXO-CTERM domain-containing protein